MAKKKPQTEQKTTLKTWAEVDAHLKAIAVIMMKVSQEEATLNEKILQLQQSMMPGLERLKSEQIGLERDIQLYCEANKSQFDLNRSRELNYGVVGFRRGSGALKTLKGFTWEAVKNLIKASRSLREKYLRIKEDIDKNALLASGMKTEQMAKLGLHIYQEDNFYLEVYLKETRHAEGEVA